MKSEAEFSNFYDLKLRPGLTEMDQERKIMAGKTLRLWFIPLIYFSILGAFMWYVNQRHEAGESVKSGPQLPLVMLLGFVLAIGLPIVIYRFSYLKRIRAIKSRFKEEVIGKMVKFVDEKLAYSPHAGISQAEYMSSHIFLTRPDRYHCEDMVSGILGKTGIRFSEVHAEQKRESNNNGRKSTTWVTIFRGILFVADFNKHFVGRTVVLPDFAEGLLGSFGAMFQKMAIGRDQLIKLEDPDFEKSFVVYGTDQVEARYILSPSLMKRIMEFKKKSGGICLSFINSQVYLAISVRENLFEPSLFSTLLNEKRMVRYYNYLELSASIVDDLNLNTRIWTKE